MVQYNNSTNFSRFGGFFLFIVMTTACFGWFVWSVYHILDLLFSKAHVVYFDKGSLYMLGAGIGLASLTFAILYEGILRRNLTEKVTKVVTRSALTGVLLMFMLPHVLHYLANMYLAEKSYVVCDEVSYQWLLYKKLVYTNNQLTCEILTREKEITKGSSGR